MHHRLREMLTPAPIPRCGACHRPVGPSNEVRERVGLVITACATCAVPPPLRGEDCRCWVRDRPAEEGAGMRAGAHDVRCPVWVPSLESFEAAEDAAVRLRLDR